MKEWVRDLPTKSKKIFSQSGQDGILENIFLNIDPTTEYCIEFGFNTDTLTGGSGPNISNLVVNHGWECLLLDGGNENTEINLHKHFITPDNVCELFEKYNVPPVPGYIGIDVDSTDLWLFKEVVKKYRADVFTVEFNSNFPVTEKITIVPDPIGRWEGDMCYGASLGALNLVAIENGYSLVHVDGVLDAFFIQNDLIDDETDVISPDISYWRGLPLRNHYQLTQRWGTNTEKIEEKLNQLMDYGTYTTSGSIQSSIEAARPVCEKYIL